MRHPHAAFLGLGLLAFALLDSGPFRAAPALADQRNRCAHLRESLSNTKKSLSSFEESVRAVQPRLDAISKQIDALSVQEADFYLTHGGLNPTVERQLTQLRAEYKSVYATTKHDRDQIKSIKGGIAAAVAEMRAEGCGAEASSNTSEAGGQFEHEITFLDQDDKKTTLLMKTRKDYNGLVLSGKFVGSIIGNGTIEINCPPLRDGVFLTYHRPHVYECDLVQKVYDQNDRLYATSQGKADVKLTLERDHKSQMVITEKPGIVVRDVAGHITMTSHDYKTTLWGETSFK